MLFIFLRRIFGIRRQHRIGRSVHRGIEVQMHQLTCDRCQHDEGQHHRAKPKEDFQKQTSGQTFLLSAGDTCLGVNVADTSNCFYSFARINAMTKFLAQIADVHVYAAIER